MPFAASAVPISPIGQTSGEVTAPLDYFGLGVLPTGTAEASMIGDNPIFFFDITGGEIDPDGNAVIEHEGSGFELFSLDMPSTSVSVANLLIDTGAGTVSGNVDGNPVKWVLATFGEITEDGIQLLLSSGAAGGLTDIFGLADFTGREVVLANTSPVPVPLPAALPLLVAGLGSVLVVARRRKA